MLSVDLFPSSQLFNFYSFHNFRHRILRHRQILFNIRENSENCGLMLSTEPFRCDFRSNIKSDDADDGA